jgi:hypothetical protein
MTSIDIPMISMEGEIGEYVLCYFIKVNIERIFVNLDIKKKYLMLQKLTGH